jgi:hypothetical protein
MRPRNRTALATAAALGTVIVASACGSSRKAPPERASQPRPSPSTFGNTPSAKNPWFPLTAGYQSVRLGKVNRGHRRLTHRRVYTVTDVVKTIEGIRAVGVLDQDFDGGQIGEQALDFLAVDKRGTVWYLGSYTEGYEGGRFVNANDGWLAGVNGARRGIYMPANPRVGMPAYVQEQHPGSDPTIARIVKRGQRTCVPFRCFNDTLVIEEDRAENKYFARGVGGVRTEPKGGGEQEVEELINLTHLSPRGVAEMSAEVLKLDRHARQTVPAVFGHSHAARRRR